MAAILYKWLMVFVFAGFSPVHHPIFVSVTNIEHNAADKTLEISCKIFTDDFETTLRKLNNTKIDLLDDRLKPAMNTLVNNYIQKHLAIVVDGKPARMEFLGFEQQEEGITSYFEVKQLGNVRTLEIVNDLLYEYQPRQMGIVHVTVKGERKSSRLDNPDSKASFSF